LVNVIISKIIEIGPVIILPLVLFIIGLVTTKKILSNFLNNLYLLLGLIGLSISLTLLVNYFKPVINVIMSFSGKELTVVDTGWFVSRQVIINSPITLYIVIAILALNLIMLLLHMTRTINIDLWSWWIFIAAGSLVFSVTEIRWLSILAAVIVSGITLVFSDIYAPVFEKYYGITGITNNQTNLIVWSPLTQLVNIILEKIPFVKKIGVRFTRLCYKLGPLSEPLIIGFILGFIMGIFIKYRTISTNTVQDILYSAGQGIYLAALVTVIPKMSTLIFKGLAPAVNDILQFINRKITKRELHVSLNALLFAGNPSVICASVVLIPFTAYIASILPGNKIMPAADLILIPLLLVMILAQSRGDLVRTFLSAALIIPLTLWIATDMSSLFEGFFIKYNIEVVQNIKNFSSYGAGSNWLFWIILQIIKPLLNIFM
jgi:galactitol PTS system EIIC component